MNLLLSHIVRRTHILSTAAVRPLLSDPSLHKSKTYRVSSVHHPGNGHHGILNRTMASAAAKRLAGKTVLITGASSGIGRSTAFEFARTSPDNLRLILTARRVDALNELASQITQEVGNGVKVLPVKLDISNAEDVRGFIGTLPEGWQDINVLVNNA